MKQSYNGYIHKQAEEFLSCGHCLSLIMLKVCTLLMSLLALNVYWKSRSSQNPCRICIYDSSLRMMRKWSVPFSIQKLSESFFSVKTLQETGQTKNEIFLSFLNWSCPALTFQPLQNSKAFTRPFE